MRDKKKPKRPKSEVTKIQQKYLGTVTTMKDDPQIKAGKFLINFEP